MKKQQTGVPLLLALLFNTLTCTLSAQSTMPAIGIPTFACNEPVAEGSLLLLGEAAERGVSGNAGFRVVDRRRLDAVFLARQEVRNEDYLASDRESIAAIGADYLLVGRVLKRQVSSSKGMNEKSIPNRRVSLTYTLKLTLLDVASGGLLLTQQMNVSGSMLTQVGEPEMDLPDDALIPQLEQQVAKQLARKTREFMINAIKGEMEVVDIIHQGSKTINDVLIASTLAASSGTELNVYMNEYYVVSGDTLVRPILLGEARVRRTENRLLVCKVLSGGRKLYDAYSAGHKLYALPGDQRSHWALRFMSMGIID